MSRGEAVVEKTRKHGFVFTEGGHAVADVAGGKNVEIAAQPAGAAALGGNGNHGRDVDDRFACLERRTGVLLQTRKQNREPGSAADRDDPNRPPAGGK